MAVVGIALVAVFFDVRTRRIPNYLTLSAAAAAFLYALVAAGLLGLGQSALAWFVGAVLLFPFFALGGMGAGDVKLVAALSAWLGPYEAVWLVVFASIAGGVVAVVVSLAHGYLRQAFVNVWLMLMTWRVAGPRPVAGLTLRDTKGPRLAYAIPIAIGVLCTVWQR